MNLSVVEGWAILAAIERTGGNKSRAARILGISRFFFISYVLVSGFGNYLIPLQVGARDMAYPFLNMLSYWVALLSALVMLASFFVTGGAAAAGWTAYPPLSALPAAVPGWGPGQTLWLLSMALFIASFTMSSLNFVATIFSLRARGMALMRMSLTVWSFFISAIVGLLAFPPLTGPVHRGCSLAVRGRGCTSDLVRAAPGRRAGGQRELQVQFGTGISAVAPGAGGSVRDPGQCPRSCRSGSGPGHDANERRGAQGLVGCLAGPTRVSFDPRLDGCAVQQPGQNSRWSRITV